MITKENFKELLKSLRFTEEDNVYTKVFFSFDSKLEVDFNHERMVYPDALVVNERQICNFSKPENFVVFECVHRLLEKGYQPKDIELEKRWTLGHTAKGGRADICVQDATGLSNLMIIECKTYGAEYNKALSILKNDGGQLFSYLQQERSTQWISLYASDYEDGSMKYKNDIVATFDDPNILELARKDDSIKLYKNAHSVEDLFLTWKETYGFKIWEGFIFGEDTSAYNIGVKPLRKKDLKDFNPEDKVINSFEEILRHNNVSDKENAFNRLVALFICKLVDEIEKDDEDIVDFQYKQGSDTYESLQDRLQRLHRDGMEKFMKEETFYISADYPDKLFANYTGKNRSKAIRDLKEKFKMLKFYSNNDFAFKDVHNEELFLQNGKILVEMVQLFERYRIVYSSRHQFLGDLFEQLLNKGFKQNEGQFFTPGPITQFIWDAIPLEELRDSREGTKYPKVIDYACGAGHFLTDGIEAINNVYESDNNSWASEKIYGIEKDYRLARVAKISLFMNGAGDSNVIFGDGLDNDKENGIEPNSFDILVANPPYSVSAFKSHLKLKNNDFDLLANISKDSGEIEVLFIERIVQLLKPEGIAAVILPSSILSNNSGSYVGAREVILENFKIRAIVQLGSKTFSATGTNTVILFMEKFDEPPKKRDLVSDSIVAIFNGENLDDWLDKEILQNYLDEIGVEEELYLSFVLEEREYKDFEENEYFELYVSEYESSTLYKNLIKKKSFKKANQVEKNVQVKRQFYDFVKKLEEEKLYYYAFVYNQETVVVISPPTNAEQKIFLGYDWSNRKGQEGIKILQPGGMLYNSKNRSNSHEKISHLIRESYQDKYDLFDDDNNANEYLSIMSTKDMLGFQNVKFSKQIELFKTKTLEIESKYEAKYLGNVCNISIGGTPSRSNPEYFTGENLWVSISEMDGNVIYDTKEKITDEGVQNSNVKLIEQGTTLLSFKLSIGKTAIAGKDLYTNEAIAALIPKSDDILDKYIFYLFKGKLIDLGNVGYKAFGKSLNSTFLRTKIKIPVPPIQIQKSIIKNCEKIDGVYNNTRMEIKDYQNQIGEIFNNLDVANKSGGVLRLSNTAIFNLSIGKRVLSKQLSENYKIPVYSANVFEPFGMINELLIDDFSKPSVIWGIDGDWMVNVLPKGYQFYPTDHCGVLRTDEKIVHPRYLVHLLEREGKKMRFSRSYRASLDRISTISFEVSDIKIQNREMEKVALLDEKISKLKAKLETYNEKISKIVKSYL